MPPSRARRSKCRNSRVTRSWSSVGSTCCRVPRKRASSCSNGAAATLSGETLMAGVPIGSGRKPCSGAVSDDAAAGNGAGMRRPPGVGRIPVRSSSPGSENGLSLTPPSFPMTGTGVYGDASRSLAVVLAQAVILHHPFQREVVIRIGRVGSGQRVGDRLRIVHLLHCLLVDGGGRKQATVFIKCLRQGLENTEPSRHRHIFAIDHLARRAVDGQLRSRCLDAKRVVAAGWHRAAPGTFDGPLRNGDRCGYGPTLARRDGGVDHVVWDLAEPSSRHWRQVLDQRTGGQRIIGGTSRID